MIRVSEETAPDDFALDADPDNTHWIERTRELDPEGGLLRAQRICGICAETALAHIFAGSNVIRMVQLQRPLAHLSFISLWIWRHGVVASAIRGRVQSDQAFQQ